VEAIPAEILGTEIGESTCRARRNKKTPCGGQRGNADFTRMQLSQSLISQISLPELAPYANDHSRDNRCRLPGFTGPIPSTSLDKAIQLLLSGYRDVKSIVKRLRNNRHLTRRQVLPRTGRTQPQCCPRPSHAQTFQSFTIIPMCCEEFSSTTYVGRCSGVGECLLTCGGAHDDPGKSAQALIFPPGSVFVLIDRPNGKVRKVTRIRRASDQRAISTRLFRTTPSRPGYRRNRIRRRATR
jgi:hypothetical protein